MTKEKFKDVPMFKSLLINFIDINTLKTKNRIISYIHGLKALILLDGNIT